MTGFRACGNCLQFGGLVGTPLKKKLVKEKHMGYCSKCRTTYYMLETDFKIGDVCPCCSNGIIKQKNRFVEYCPKCNGQEMLYNDSNC